jgi:hypothetical protein
MARLLRAVRREALEHEEHKGWQRTAPDNPMVDEAFRLQAQARDALLRFRDEKPFGLVGDAFTEALKTLYRTLAHVYDMPEPQVWHDGEWTGDSGTSEYVPGQHAIILRGGKSILTALHEFAHARGYGEHGAVWWSVNAFKTTWPASYDKLAVKFARPRSGPSHYLCGRALPVEGVEPATFDYRESPEPGVRKVELNDPAPPTEPTPPLDDVSHVTERAKRLDLR